MFVKKRCAWVGRSNNTLMIRYHDKEWGVPVHNDQKLFEFLVLEGAQAGLNWQTILTKRTGYKKAFYNFNPKKVALMTEKDIKRLMNNSGIVRNRLKIKSAINNARQFLKIQKEFGSFNAYIWKFVNNKPIKNKVRSIKDIPATTKESDKMSEDLKKRGFTFVGATICYAFMQAVGMVNDHEITCFRYNKVTK